MSSREYEDTSSDNDDATSSDNDGYTSSDNDEDTSSNNDEYTLYEENPYGYYPQTNEDLREAVNSFYFNRRDAICRYGFPINWDTSLITDMSDLFKGKSTFNEPIRTWITENVVSMTGMFEGAASFNQDISQWNIRNVTDMSNMFLGASMFYGCSIENWNISLSRRNMIRMFDGPLSIPSWAFENID
jgi:surface protein